MSTSKYIRPMSFFETVGTMYRLYLKVMIPIIIVNVLLSIFTLTLGLFAGLFVGPVLVMTSNAILGKRVKALESIRKGIFSVSFLKIALLSIGYIILIVIVSYGLLSVLVAIINTDTEQGLNVASFLWLILSSVIYLFLMPFWIFSPIIMLLEKRGMGASLKKSFQILRKNLVRVLQMDLFITLIWLAIAILLPILFGDVINLSNITVYSILGTLLACITGFNSLPYVFVYYEYRARYEDYNEELLTQDLGYQPIEEMMAV